MLSPLGAPCAPVIPSYSRADKMQLARLCTGSDATGRRIPPGYRSVLFKLVDERGASYWSTARLAAACGVSIRTVGRAIAYWRHLGVITVWWRKHQTPIRCVMMAKALSVLNAGVQLAIGVCAVAAHAARRVRGFLNRPKMADYSHLMKIEEDGKSKPHHQGASPEFLALIAAAKNHPGRRNP